MNAWPTVDRSSSQMHTTSTQTILAPAVMTSASALFLLELNTCYVALITRIRLLNDERSELLHPIQEPIEHGSIESDRLLRIEHQYKY